MDITAAAGLLCLLSPVIAVVAGLIFVFLGRPLLFRQVRIGKDNREFLLLKFRTMRDDRDHLGRPLADSERLPWLGKVLRAASLDELPQLWNVLRGEMSLIGPRPLLPEYLPKYTPRQAKRHLVKPGITGLAQVKGRNSLSWEERFELDVYYVEHQSLWLDLHIAWMTVLRVLSMSGVSAAGHATMHKFEGSPSSPSSPSDHRGPNP